MTLQGENMKKKTLLSLIAACGLFLTGLQATADTVALNPDHPDRYTVVKGDTLWDISARFLRDPWKWPSIWNINPDIKNPHLIYPGDVILLKMVNGQPVLTLERGHQRTGKTAEGLDVVKLSPRIRTLSLEEEAIPVIPNDAIKQFLKYPRIISKRELEDSGYIVAGEDDALINGSNDKVYARDLTPNEQNVYDVLRKGRTYTRGSGWGSEFLGYEMLRVADAKVVRYDDPSTLIITSANREVLTGDRLLPVTEEREMSMNYQPHAPDQPINGTIIGVLDGVSRIGQYHTVVIDIGKHDNIEPGHVLAIYQAGDTIRDTVTDSWNNKVTLPDERAGMLMVVRAFDRVSYALVMEAYKDMKVNDSVTNP
jgi:LysM repeat protein